MRYLAKVVGMPKASTGDMNVIVPSLSGDTIKKASPLKPYLGLYEPYRLGEIVVVEMIENVLYYGDKPYAVGEYDMGVPKNSYSFVTPYGYIAFTPTDIIIKHVNGKQATITTGSPIATPTKWR